MSFWLEVPGRNQLTPEQQKIVALPSEPHLLVLGPPGSGKTVTLLYRADKLRTESQVSDERFLIGRVHECSDEIHTVNSRAIEYSSVQCSHVR